MALMVCGVPRSGTTLLRRLCDGHQEVALTHESRIFAFPVAPVWTHARNVSANTVRMSWEAARTGRGHQVRPRARFLRRYLTELLRSRPRVVDTEARESILRRMYNVRIVGDKYPGYVFDLETFVEDRHLSCLVIYRDGRDVVSSTLHAVRTRWKGLGFVKNIDTVERIAARWVYGIEKMRRYGDRAHCVRYEDLVRDPLAVMTGVDPKGFPTTEVSRRSVGGFRNGLTQRELDLVSQVAGGTLVDLDYG